MPEFPMLAAADADRCGIGQEGRCCAYLLVGPRGLECGRVDLGMKELVEERVASDLMSAQRLPTEPFPDCQLGDDDA